MTQQSLTDLGTDDKPCLCDDEMMDLACFKHYEVSDDD